MINYAGTTADAGTTGGIYETIPERYVSRVDEIRWNREKRKEKKKQQDKLSRDTSFGRSFNYRQYRKKLRETNCNHIDVD